MLKLPGIGVIICYIFQHKNLWKFRYIFIRADDAGYFSILGVQHRENKPLKFLNDIIRSVLSTLRITELKQKSLCWLCHCEFHQSNLYNGTNGVQLIKTLKQNVFSFYYSTSDIATEKYKINKRTCKG